MEGTFPALAGGFSITGPPGKHLIKTMSDALIREYYRILPTTVLLIGTYLVPGTSSEAEEPEDTDAKAQVFEALECHSQAESVNYWITKEVPHQGSVAAAPRLEGTGSKVVAYGLSCSEACEILLNQRLNLCLLHRKADSLSLRHQGRTKVF